MQLSLPLSLGLLGSLSIIRFRTPIKEPEEVGFIMLVIAASISCATFNFQFLLIMYGVAVLALLLLRGWRRLRFFRDDGVLVAVLAAPDPERSRAVLELVKAATSSCRLESSSARPDRSVSLQVAFTGLREEVTRLQARIRELDPESTVSVVMNRTGVLR